MANVAKYSRDACGHLCKHFERAKDGNGEYINFSNQNIDTSRTHLNYNLAPDRPDGQYAYIKQRTGEVRCLDRADVKVMCSWILTAPKGLAEEEQERFFRTAYKAFAEKYGERNVISAWVHMDETQPHMHFAFVPVVQDKKRGGEKVSAKELLTKTELKNFHPWLTDVMTQEFGYDVGVETGELGTRGNLTIEQYKVVQEANREAAAARQEVAELIAEKDAQAAQIEEMKRQLPEIEQTNAAIDAIGEMVEEIQRDSKELRSDYPKDILKSYMEEIRQPFTGKPTGDYRITGENVEKLAKRIRSALDLTERKWHIGSIYREEYTEPSKIERWATEARNALAAAYKTVSGTLLEVLQDRYDDAQRTISWLQERLDAAQQRLRKEQEKSKELAAEQDRLREFLARYSVGNRSLVELYDESRRKQPEKSHDRAPRNSEDLEL